MIRLLLSAVLLFTTSSCVLHGRATDFSGVAGIRGEPVEYQTTTSYSLAFVFVWHAFGDATLQNTVKEFSAEASERGAQRVRITNTSSSTYWWVFPPISFFVHPVVTTVQGDIEGAASGE